MTQTTLRALAATLLGAAVACFSSCSGSTHADSQSGPSPSGQVRPRVGVVKPERKDLTRKIDLPGTLAAFNEATLYGKVAGYLRAIPVDKGDRVRTGQMLATIEVPEMAKEVEQAEALLKEAVATLNRSKAELELQRTTYERYRDVQSRDPEAISKQEIDEWRNKFELAKAEVELAEAKISTARANRDRFLALDRYSRITAPFSGVVTARFVDPGALIQAATSSVQAQPIVTIQDFHILRTYINIPEVDVAMIRRGSKATLTTAAYPGKVFEASVTRFSEALDPASRTMKTEMDIPNPLSVLRPGMYVDVTLELESHPLALVIPDAALVVEDNRKYIYVVREGAAHRVALETGLDDGNQVEVLSGLKGDEQVIVTGKEGLAEGKPIEPSPVGSWTK